MWKIQQTETDEFGLINVMIGQGNTIGSLNSNSSSLPNAKFNSFDAIIWDENQKTLAVDVSFDGGKTFGEVSSQKLSFSPYALYAEAVEYKNVREAPKKLSQFANDSGYLIPKDLDPISESLLLTNRTIKSNQILTDQSFAIVSKQIFSLSDSIQLNSKTIAKNTFSISDIEKKLVDVNGLISETKNESQSNLNRLNSNINGLQSQLFSTNNALSNLSATYEVVDNKSTATDLGNASPSDLLYPTQKAIKTYVDTKVADLAGGSIADATTLAPGKIQLAGDLGGTALSPTVPGLASKENLTNKSTNLADDANSDSKYPTVRAVKSYVDQATQGIALQANLDAKANTSDVNSALSTKENASNKSNNSSLGNSDDLFPTQKAVKSYVDNQVANGIVSDADASTKGKIQLAGDLGGTAASPTVPGLALKANASDVTSALSLKANASDVSNSLASKANTSDVTSALADKENSANKSTSTALGTSDILYPSQKAVKTYVDAQVASGAPDADASTKGKIQLTGDLGGTAASPTVPGLALKAPINNPTFTGTVGGLDKSMVGLSNIDNTSDANKPISSATQTALNLKANTADVTNELSLKANASDVSTSLALKANTSDVNSALNLKANAADVTSALADKENSSNKSTSTALGTSDILYPSQKAVKTYVDAQVASGAPDADASTKGKIQLTGDLGGTAASPTVPDLALKAPINNPTFTGTVGGIDKSMVGLSNIDNTSDANKPISSATQTALNLKANTADVTNELALKANASDVSTSLASKANSSDVTSALNLKANSADVTSELSLKANASDVSSSLAAKANTADVTSALNLKANAAAVTSALADKENSANKSTSTALGTSDMLYPSQKAVKTYVDAQVASGAPDADASTKGKIQLTGDLGGTAASPTVPGLALKAPINNPTFTGTVGGIDKSMVGLSNIDNTSDANKPISSATQTALNLKANTADVTSELALKANASDVSTSLASKANTADVTTALNLKANASDVSTSLALKANTADVTTALNLKANAADVTSALADKENSANKSTSTALGTSDILYPSQKAVKTYVDAQVASGAPDADASTKGKIQLTGDLGGTAASPTVPGLALKAPINNPTFTGTVGGIDKSMVGLSNIDNTSDANKPISSATQTALNLKANTADVTNELALKANASDVSTSLASKANTADVTTALNLKANASDVSSSLALKANSSDVTSSLNLKANAADVTSALADKENNSNKSTSIALGTSDILYPSQKAVKTYVDTQAPDANTSTKGKIRLAGDLGGEGSTASSPVISESAINNNKLADNAVTSSKILNGTISTNDLADNLITNSKIASGAVSSDELANGAVTDSKINSVSGSKVSGNISGGAAFLSSARSIYGNSFDGRTSLNQIISSSFGGTGNGFTKFSGPSSSEKTFTLPNSNATILTSASPVTVGQGGTGSNTLASNQVLLGNGTSALQTVAPGNSGNVLMSNGTTWVSSSPGNSNNGSSHAIGDSYGGGIIFYVYDGGAHGLIAARNDQSSNADWDLGTGYETRARANGIGAGLKNTTLIIASEISQRQSSEEDKNGRNGYNGEEFAATICNEFYVSTTENNIETTFGDWYLPSKYELNLLYQKRTTVGNFASDKYWSSTEYDSDKAWTINFATRSGSAESTQDKTDGNRVRAIRAF
jgi:hypothetical protein